MNLVGDIGGTTMRLAFGDNGTIKSVARYPTPEAPAEALRLISAYVALQSEVPSGMVAGIAGTFQGGVLIESPNLPAWEGAPLEEEWTQELSFPIRLYNDAAIAGVAEARIGAGKGTHRVGYVTVGTGVGGALLEDGRLAPAARTLEPGKKIIDHDTGRTLESLVGGAALEKEFGMPAAGLPRSVLDERAGVLAEGLYGLVREWRPDMLVLNGSLMDEKDGYRMQVVSARLAHLAGTLPLPPLALAAFRDESGLIGASLM